MKYFNKIKQYKNIILWGLIILFAGAYVSLSFNNNIWGDEAYTIDLLRNCRSMGDVWLFTAQDVHPPLYYMIVQVFTNVFGLHLTLLKIVSIIPILITMAIGATYITKKYHFKTGLLFILMIGVIPCSMEYAVQVRMYSWTILFVTICGLASYEAYVNGKNKAYLVMGLSGVACAYTHYFAFVSILWIYGLLFLALLFTKRKELLKWLFMVMGSILLFSPWIPFMKGQVSGVSGSYWIPEITKKVIVSYFGWLFETKLPYAPLMLQILFLVAILLVTIHIVRNRKNKEAFIEDIFALCCLLIPILTITTGVVLSQIIRPIFIIRYVMPCIGLLCLFFAKAMSRLDKKTFIALVLFCICLGFVDYENTYQEEYLSTTVDEIEEFFQMNLGENDVIVYNFRTYDFIYEYYFDKDKLIYIEDMDFSVNFDNIWFLDTAFNLEPSKETLEANGLSMFHIGNYNIEYNPFSLYQICKQTN